MALETSESDLTLPVIIVRLEATVSGDTSWAERRVVSLRGLRTTGVVRKCGRE
jgi:hypothetical protein